MTSSSIAADQSEALLARIDIATVCSALSVSVGGASKTDLHLFTYLSCMAYAQQQAVAPSSWGYRFLATDGGLPFSLTISQAAAEMLKGHELEDSEEGLTLGRRFGDLYAVVAEGAAYRDRVALVADVTNLVVFRSLPKMLRALRNEPQLRRALAIQAVRDIDDQQLTKSLIELMVSIRNKLPAHYPPSAPAMLWLDEWETGHED